MFEAKFQYNVLSTYFLYNMHGSLNAISDNEKSELAVLIRIHEVLISFLSAMVTLLAVITLFFHSVLVTYYYYFLV